MRALYPFSLALLVGCGAAMTNDMGGIAMDSTGTTGSEASDTVGTGAGGAGTLTAAEWRDLENWDFWTDLLERQDSPLYGAPDAWGFAFDQRIPVDVVDGDTPAADVGVTLRDAQQQVLWQARTDTHGHAELFAGSFGAAATGPYQIEVDTGRDRYVVEEVSANPEEPVVIDVVSAEPPVALDLMFVVDTTGSMGDELSYLQVELADVIDQVHDQVGANLDLRVSVNFYRDHGDAYLVRSFPFTEDATVAVSQLGDQGANGGGDWPEAVDEALDDAVFGHDWRASARSRLLFLVLDAPPHDDQQGQSRLAAAVTEAAAKGIRIVPLAASGVDKPTEALLRSIDIATGATYTFLTDDSGIGNDHLEPTVGQYEVEPLNELLIRLTVESVAM